MAKELPYFKFNVSEYSHGDITICSYSAQGLWINICCFYWSREGDLTEDKLLKRFPFEEEIKELKEEGILTVKGGKVIIKFLDEQLDERGKMSQRNRENVLKRYEKNTSRKQVVNESNTIKRRKEKKREEYIEVESIVSVGVWEEWRLYKQEQFNFEYKSTASEKAALTELSKLSKGDKSTAEKIINQSISKGWKGFFAVKEGDRSTNPFR